MRTDNDLQREAERLERYERQRDVIAWAGVACLGVFIGVIFYLGVR